MGITSTLAFAATAAVLYGVVDVDAAWPRPAIGMGWQWELTMDAVPDVTTPNVPVWDVDPEQLDSTDIPTLMNDLHANNRYIICYVNVGSLDTTASDASRFKAVTPTIIGKAYPDWPGEYFLDIRRNETRSLIKARFKRMASYGCHAIEPDNLDTYTYDTFPLSKPDLTLNDALNYLDWISTTVHGLGMAVGLKNSADLITPYNLVPKFDFAIVESCAEFPGDCAKYGPFIQAGKPVFAAEYTDIGSGGCTLASSVASACSVTNAANFEGIIKSCDLGPEYHACQAYDNNGYRTAP
ncbi:Glycoside-hydrolase family GH114 TIM-barrel domain-containing protein [Plasmodiophora brassicae]